MASETMKTTSISALALLLTGLLPALALAEAKGPQELPDGAVFRYQDSDGNTRMGSTLPRDAVPRGYEVVGRDGRVLETVDPEPTGEEREAALRAREQERAQEQQRERDRELRSMYGDAENARRVRDRRIEAIQVNIDYARNSIQQAERQLEGEIASAAELERAGREVPDGVEEAIDHYNRQIDSLEEDIEEYEADIEGIRQQFEPVIRRLRELEQQ